MTEVIGDDGGDGRSGEIPGRAGDDGERGWLTVEMAGRGRP